MIKEETTFFGYKKVPLSEKERMVASVFDSVVSHYDLMNDLMSFGMHRLWKNFTAALLKVRSGQKILDLAGGTGDLSMRILPHVGNQGLVVLADINFNMLDHGRCRIIDNGVIQGIAYVQADAEHLPFSSDTFDYVTIGFGLRNFTSKDNALNAIYHVLKPGGQLVILEFSKPVFPALQLFYDFYSFLMIPALGRLITKDANSYQYLVESIRMHPNQQELLTMMENSGFEMCSFINVAGGIVAIHRGYKIT